LPPTKGFTEGKNENVGPKDESVACKNENVAPHPHTPRQKRNFRGGKRAFTIGATTGSVDFSNASEVSPDLISP
jgi:hypothetical protein